MAGCGGVMMTGRDGNLLKMVRRDCIALVETDRNGGGDVVEIQNSAFLAFETFIVPLAQR